MNVLKSLQPSSRNRLRMLVILAGVALLVPALVLAQSYTGSVTGLVTDPSGAVVPNAQVRLVDEDKGFSFAAASDSAGRQQGREHRQHAWRERSARTRQQRERE